jgi:nicotinamidase-related amidase
MPDRNPDLHGFVPDKSPVALLIIDVVNEMDFSEAEQMMPAAIAMADRSAELKKRAKAAGIPAIYVNDNFGRWQSDFRSQVEHCLRDGVRGKPIVERLCPEQDDYSVLKPKHSGFYSSSLDLLLKYLGTKDVILTGIAGNLCVLYTANDAYMRDFGIIVPSDCCVSNSREENEYALDQMRKSLHANTTPADQLDLEKLLKNQHE